MFDLFRSREKSVRWLLGALLGLVALSMVITLVPNYSGMGGSRVDQTIVAEIGDDTITTTDVRQALARASRSGSIPHGMEQVFAPMVVQQMIADRAIAYEANRLGMDVSEEELAAAIQMYIPQLFQGGKFAGKEIYSAYLQQMGTTIPEFERDLKKQILTQRMEALALEGSVVTPAQVEEDFRKRNEKIKVAYFQLSPDKFKSQVTATPEEIASNFAQNRGAYMIPEKRDYLIYQIDQAQVAASLTVSEQDLHRAYTEQRERYRIPERVHVRHILLKTADKPQNEVAAIRKRIEDLLKQAKSGADFAALAQKNSEDTASAVKGGDIDWIGRGQTVPEFEKAAFTLKPGEISGVITTVYGFHILKVEQKEQAHTKTFEEVKGELLAEVQQARASEKVQALADQIHAALGRSAAEAAKLAEANGIKGMTVQKVALQEEVPGIGKNPQFDEAVSGLKKGGITPAFALSATQLAVIQATEIYPARPAELAEVQDRVKDAVLAAKLQKLIQDKTREAAQKLKAGEDLAAVAKQLGAEVKTTSTEFSRGGAAEGIGAADQIAATFDKKVGETAGPFAVVGGTYFTKVLSKTEADMSQLPAQHDQIVSFLKSQAARERRDLFTDGLVDMLVKQKKIKIHDDNIKRMVAGYRS
jgi:peptidyl-prolyl cis-trans isomerase D